HRAAWRHFGGAGRLAPGRAARSHRGRARGPDGPASFGQGGTRRRAGKEATGSGGSGDPVATVRASVAPPGQSRAFRRTSARLVCPLAQEVKTPDRIASLEALWSGRGAHTSNPPVPARSNLFSRRAYRHARRIVSIV